MKTPAIGANIIAYLREVLLNEEEMFDLLESGDLLAVEQSISAKFRSLQTEFTQAILCDFCADRIKSVSEHYETEAYGRYQKATSHVQLITGETIEIPDFYSRNCKVDVPEGHRYLMRRHFSVIGHGSPAYVSMVGLAASACPSYQTGNELLMNFGLKQSTTRVRNLTNALGEYCKGKEPHLILHKGESLKEKRVVISIDGGRCRTRTNTERVNEAGNMLFDTEWREPKLFVIQVLDADGKIEAESKPIYGTRFNEMSFWQLLKEHLKELKIEHAKEVQVIADGAVWIWDKVSDFLQELGVLEHKITLALDYFHASTYLAELVKSLPQSINEKKRKQIEVQCKELIWSGKSTEAVRIIAEMKKRPSKEETRWRNYLIKHESKMQYAHYQDIGWMCGSGIVESGIRRVINLRFKNTGTFWDINTVEKLFFLRGAYLSGRWKTVMSNIANNVF